mmetsp:Transcript_45313/g.129368  ORF Transcript_45313/g.129368 Transcript_45313/m.129368 type:complete len:202 (-) Transcript_45313:6-611(-)
MARAMRGKSDYAKVHHAWQQTIGKEMDRCIAGRSLDGNRGSPHTSSAGALQSISRQTASPSGSASAGDHGFVVGSPVYIRDMRRRKELNGSVGKIVRDEPDEHGRVSVRLSALGGAQTPKVMRVHASRLAHNSSGLTHDDELDQLLRWGMADGSRVGFPGFGVFALPRARSSGELLPPRGCHHRAFHRSDAGGFWDEAKEP